MKSTELEDSNELIRNIDLREFRVELLGQLNKMDGRLNKMDERLNKMDGRLNNLERIIWVPVLTSVAQIIVTLLHK